MNNKTGIITNEKIERITKKLNSKNLSRAEKRELTEELNWEKYRADPRPSMTLKKFKLLDAVVYFGDMVIFGYMGIVDNMKVGLTHKGFNAGDIFMLVTIVLLIAMIVIYLMIHDKYKSEPMDELANRNMTKASHSAFLCLIGVGLVFAFVKGIFYMDGVTTIKNNSMINLLCVILFFYDFLTNMIFVFLESRDGANSEEDE